MDIPLTTDQVTADWVGHAPARAGICDADDVASVRVNATRDSVAAAGIYKVESDVYGLFATEIGLPVPRCYPAAESTGTGLFTFLLEDISPA